MRFGLAFLGDADLGETVAWARELDRNPHLDSIWVADERFLRDPWVQLGALAAATSRVKLGVSVTDPYIRHPALTAAAAATLQELSGGRAVLGLGAGSTGFAALGIEPRLPAVALAECVELCRRLWQETQPFSFSGRMVRLVDACLDFRPQAPVPIYVAARGPKVFSAAARHADVVLIGSFARGRGLAYALDAISAGEMQRDPSLPPLRRAAWIYFSVAAGGAAAIRGATRGIALALRSSHRLLTEIGYEIPAGLLEFIESRRHTLTPGEVDWVADRLPRELVDDLTVAGTVEDCIATLRGLETAGVDEVLVLPFAPEGGAVREMVELMVSEVAPALAG